MNYRKIDPDGPQLVTDAIFREPRNAGDPETQTLRTLVDSICKSGESFALLHNLTQNGTLRVDDCPEPVKCLVQPAKDRLRLPHMTVVSHMGQPFAICIS